MTTEHPSEIELQQYVLDKPGCTTEIIEHIEVCENCQANVAMYRLLFFEIKQQPKPAFDFDVSGLVLSQIPTAKSRFLPDSFFTYVLAVIVFCTIGIPLYLFRKNILNMFTEISTFFMYTIVAATIIIVLFKIMDMYKRYQKQMRALNFY